MRGRSVQSS